MTLGNVCFFCGGTPLSKEHLWGRWLYERHRNPTQDVSKARGSHTVTEYSPQHRATASKGIFRNSGHPLSTTTKSVCRDCNNTWMSGIEKEMKPCFEQLVSGHPPNISRDDCRAISLWSFLKQCLWERAFPAPAIELAFQNTTFPMEELQKARATRWRDFYRTRDLAENTTVAVIRTVDNRRDALGAHQVFPSFGVLDLSRFSAAPSARLSHFPFESDGAFPAQC